VEIIQFENNTYYEKITRIDLKNKIYFGNHLFIHEAMIDFFF